MYLRLLVCLSLVVIVFKREREHLFGFNISDIIRFNARSREVHRYMRKRTKLKQGQNQ